MDMPVLINSFYAILQLTYELSYENTSFFLSSNNKSTKWGTYIT